MCAEALAILGTMAADLSILIMFSVLTMLVRIFQGILLSQWSRQVNSWYNIATSHSTL
jgi:hypothetical protein